MKKTWIVLLLTMVMGVGVPALFGSVYTVAGNYEWSNWLFAAGFVGLPLLVWPGYELWLTMWACKDRLRRWFLPVLFPILLMSTCALWAGGLSTVFVVVFAVMLVLSVIVMLIMPKEE